MPTGACGINCDMCRLRLLGACSSCGSGRSQEAPKKLEAQKRIFGGTCTILECAVMNRIEFCLRDCDSFPCDNFTTGPYPFSRGFLDMQERRRKEKPPALTHNAVPVCVPEEYWDILKTKDINTLCNLTLAEPFPTDQSGSSGIIIRVLNENILVDVNNRCIKRKSGEKWEVSNDPLLELITLLYLNNIKDIYPIGKDIVGTKDLKESHFFQGVHELNINPLLERYGNNLDGFKLTAEYLEGTRTDMADAAYTLLPFPRVQLYYLFWKGDNEFNPRIAVLFDRSIENLFSADGIWGVVNFVTLALLRGRELDSSKV